MNREQILSICNRTRDVGQTKHTDFADYVITMTSRKKTDDGWQTVENPYMGVDGKLAMANEDHRLQNKKLHIGPVTVLIDNDTELTLQVAVESELYGKRTAIATSRKVDGTPAERQFPWEVAETSAIGRALSQYGYGVFPGTGLASANDIRRVEADTPTNAQPPMSPVQRAKLIAHYIALHGGSETDALKALDALFTEQFKHGGKEATYEEAARLTAQLLTELRNKPKTANGGR